METYKSPAGAHQWIPTDETSANLIEDAHDINKRHAPIMTTADLSLKLDPIYETISRRFHENFSDFEDAFARAWFKLTHRDMGPRANYLGSEVPSEELIWQDPIPIIDHILIDDTDIKILKDMLANSGFSVSELVSTAWASASTYRGSDKRGGANGARINLAPQNNWEVNNPVLLKKILTKYESIQKEFNESQISDKKVSLADIIVLGGCVGIENATKESGLKISVPFTPGRTDATIAQTDIESFSVLEPKADGFRNYKNISMANIPAEAMLVDKSQLLNLTTTEMTVLIGGMRVLNTNYNGSKLGVFTNHHELLSNDFFLNLLDLKTTWKPISEAGDIFEGSDRTTGKVKWTATRVDLIFGSNSELRAIAEVYACEDSKEKFINDFVAAWCKVMDLDRF